MSALSPRASRGTPTPGGQSDLATRPVSVVTELPGPRAKAMIADAVKVMSPSLIHVYPLMVERASGCMVEDVDGNVFLDCQAGVATASTGHCHPRVAEAIQAQSEVLIHICGTDFHYPGYGALCEKLAAHGTRLQEVAGVPADRRDGWQTFLTNSGTEGVEAAIKIARHHTKRAHLVAFRGGFHGRSLGSLSLTASKTKYRQDFGPLLAGVHHAEYGNLASVERDLFARTVAPSEVAAIVVEPVLGEGGYLVPPRQFLVGLRELCDRHKILLVFDEVQSGMGRTGTMFAAEHFGVVPDVMVLAKGLASGMPLGAMMAQRRFMTWPPGSHGSTCGGNPVCIAAALATIGLLEESLLANTVDVGSHLRGLLEAGLRDLPVVQEVRGLGLMIGVELATPELADKSADGCYRRGLLVLECGEKAIRLSPPLVITRAQAAEAAAIFISVCQSVAAAA
jgi:4-aminobutyrate aminotransferase